MTKDKKTSSQTTEKNRDIDPRLLEILICPQSGARLTYDKKAQELICKKSGLAYPIREGVPIMLVEEARTL
ncbi:MAG TPA: Trm112 family protein [Hellea balneolensis]|uniref:UPF0434 protein ENJ46_02380 n=1 Tax=Hellea balneolensis TaxID=287478 RepID=A0A7C3C400_9PROT|nr:Trm112 family protein [Hellea balneolensis]